MPRLLPILLLGAAVLAAPHPRGDVRAKDRRPPAPAIPVGHWKVEFTNGVNEMCDIFVFDGAGHATVDEPRRKSRGRVAARGGSFVISFNDDRVERWTPVGNRFVVEHWYPGSRLPTVTPVLGIAERLR